MVVRGGVGERGWKMGKCGRILYRNKFYFVYLGWVFVRGFWL